MSKSRVVIRICWTAAVLLPVPASAQNETVDFIARIEASPGVASEIGLSKLSPAEKASLNTFLNLVYRYGFEAGRAAENESIDEPRTPAVRPYGAPPKNAYKTRVESDEGDVLRLENGAIVEITSGYVGYLGYRRKTVLFQDGSKWRIWLEGKKSFPCDVLREPNGQSPSSFELVFIQEVKGDGSLLVLNDGSLLEVDDLFTIFTSLWLGYSEALLLDGSELLNLDVGDDMVLVRRIK